MALPLRPPRVALERDGESPAGAHHGRPSSSSVASPLPHPPPSPPAAAWSLPSAVGQLSARTTSGLAGEERAVGVVTAGGEGRRPAIRRGTSAAVPEASNSGSGKRRQRRQQAQRRW